MTRSFSLAPTTRVVRDARNLIMRHRMRVLAVCVMFVLTAACTLVGPWAVGKIVDDAAEDGLSVVIHYVVIMAIALLLQTGASVAASLWGMQLGELVYADLRERFMDTLIRLPLGTIERAGTGDLVTRTTRDVGMVANVLRFGLPDAMQLILTVLITVIWSFFVDPLVSLGMLVILLVVPVVIWYLRRSAPVWERVGSGFSEAGDAVAANATAARDIDLMGLADHRRQKVDTSLRELYLARMKEVFLRTVLLPATNLAFSMPVALTLLWGGFLATRGYATAGAVATVVLYVGQLASPVQRIVDWIDGLQECRVSYARILGVGEDAEEPGNTAPLIGDSVRLEQVSFAYEPGRDVLHEVSLLTRPGEHLAVVGPSGSGKSTLARIMAGIDDPREGRVVIGGESLAGHSVTALRETVCLVTQEHHVFSGTLAENLRLAGAEATDSDLEEVLDQVGASWWRQLGLGAQVGNGGETLTPVQAQQIALARLLLRDPQIVILDEATAMFDPRGARESERSLAKALEGRTVISIAHRLQTAADADRVAVMIDGRLIELGPHESLINANGEYARLWRAWQGK